MYLLPKNEIGCNGDENKNISKEEYGEGKNCSFN